MALVTDESSSDYRLLCRHYYRGDLPEVYQDFLDRFAATDAADKITQEQFCFESEISKAVTRRTNALPVNFMLTAPDDKKKLQEQWEDYFEGNNFNSKPLLQVLNDIYLDMEIGGAAIMAGYFDPDNPTVPYWLKMTNMEYYPQTDPNDIHNVTAYRFVLYRKENDAKGNKQDVTITIDIDAEEQKVSKSNGDPEKTTKFKTVDSNGDPVLAVVVFARESLDGVYYRPGVAAMLNGQRDLNLALTKRNEATKYDSFGVWCPGDREFSGLGLGGDSNGANKAWRLRPGMYVPFPLAKIGGATSIGSIEKEIEDARADVYNAGQFIDSSEVVGSTNGESGRSKMIGARGMRDYIARILPQMEDSLNQMLEISGYISGIKTEGIKFKAPPVDKEDPATVAAKAEQMHLWGFTEEALRLLEYSDKDVKKLMDEQSARQVKEEDDAVDRASKESLTVG